jgi:hypothetical protein
MPDLVTAQKYGRKRRYNRKSYETEMAEYGLFFYDDFLGSALNTTTWTARDTSSSGTTVEALIDSATGVLSLEFDTTAEAQLAGVDWNDKFGLSLANGIIWEARVRCNTMFDASAAVGVWGLCNAHNAAIDTVAVSCWFRVDGGSTAITVETDDGTNETSKIATASDFVVAAATGDDDGWLVYRIDATNPANVKFFINGRPVATSQTFDISADPDEHLQPVFRITKSSNDTPGKYEVDYVKIWSRRKATE